MRIAYVGEFWKVGAAQNLQRTELQSIQTPAWTGVFINWCTLHNVREAESNHTIGKVCNGLKKQAGRPAKKHCMDDAVRMVSALFEKRRLSAVRLFGDICIHVFQSSCRIYFILLLIYTGNSLQVIEKICVMMKQSGPVVCLTPSPDKLYGIMWGRNWNGGWCRHKKRRIEKWECALQFAKEMKRRWTLATEEVVSPLTTPTTNSMPTEGSSLSTSATCNGRNKIRKSPKQANQERINAKAAS